MPFNGKSGKFNASINAVEVGCGEKAIKIGGENVLPFYTFDAPIENAPKVGVMITDLGLDNEPEGVKAYYAGCSTMGEIAKKEWVDQQYEDGRQTVMTERELKEKIRQLAPDFAERG